MTKAKKMTSLLMTCIIMLCAILCTPITTSAATSGSKNYTSTISVVTKSSWGIGSPSITLKQSKTKYSYTTGIINKKTKTDSAYYAYKITIKGNGTTKTKTWDDASINLDLVKGKSYTITVTPDSMNTWFNTKCRSDVKWVNVPTWKISSTWRISSYY